MSSYFPDISSIRYWALWDLNRVPHFTLFEYSHFEKVSQQYVFRSARIKPPVLVRGGLEHITKLFVAGKFRPFLINSVKESNYANL